MAKRRKPGPGLITKEVFTGFLAVGLGTYNLLVMFEVLNTSIEIPQIVANVVLVLAGLFLWVMAFKAARFRYHQKQIM